MAVTKIRKLSSWTLLIISIITIGVLGMFFGGGVEDPAAENKNYIYTNLLLNWTYIVFFVTIVVLAVLAIWQFSSILKTGGTSSMLGCISVRIVKSSFGIPK